MHKIANNCWQASSAQPPKYVRFRETELAKKNCEARERERAVTETDK